MTVINSISGQIEAKDQTYTQRYATVGYVTRTPNYRRVPAITLKGCWLGRSGFSDWGATGCEGHLVPDYYQL